MESRWQALEPLVGRTTESRSVEDGLTQVTLVEDAEDAEDEIAVLGKRANGLVLD